MKFFIEIDHQSRKNIHIHAWIKLINIITSILDLVYRKMTPSPSAAVRSGVAPPIVVIPLFLLMFASGIITGCIAPIQSYVFDFASQCSVLIWHFEVGLLRLLTFSAATSLRAKNGQFRSFAESCLCSAEIMALAVHHHSRCFHYFKQRLKTLPGANHMDLRFAVVRTSGGIEVFRRR